MNPDLVIQLTNEYMKAIESEWSILHIDNIAVQLEDSYATFEEQDKELAPRSLSQILEQGQNLVILGEPGSGKSTTLQFIGLCFAHDDWYKAKLNSSKKYTPIKINLKEYAAFLSEPGPKIEQGISLAIREYLRQIDEQSALALTKRWIEGGDLLLLLDGLDEVSDALRSAVKDEIRRFSAHPTTANIKMIVTSRFAGYTSVGSHFKEFNLTPLKSLNDTKLYLQFWLKAFKPELNKLQADENAGNLLEQITNHPALKRIVNNPLILRMAAEVFTTSGKITGNRSWLYQQYVDDLWERAKIRGASTNLEGQLMAHIKTLAWQLHTNLSFDIPIEMLVLAREKMGLITQETGHPPSFNHLTVQEFFVSKYLADAWKKNRESAWEFLRLRLHVPEWQEPILLMGGGLSQSESHELTDRIYHAKSKFEKMYHRDKILVAKLAGESAFVKGKTIRKILWYTSLINSKWGRWIIGEGKWQFEDLIKAIGYFGDRAIPILSKLLYNQDDLIQSDAIGVLEEMNVQEAVPLLLKLLDETDNYLIHRGTLNALAGYKEKSIIPTLIREVRWGDWGQYTLAKFRDVEIIPILFDVVENNYTHSVNPTGSVAETLSYMGDMVVPYLYTALDSGSTAVNLCAIQTLEKLAFQEAAPRLLKKLKDKDDNIREASIYALAGMNASIAIPELRNILLNDGVDWIRSTAARALGSLNAKESIQDLAKATQDPSEYVREASINSLRKLEAYDVLYQAISVSDNPTIFEYLKSTIPNPIYSHDFGKAEAITIFEDRREDSVKYLCEQLDNTKDAGARWTAAEVLRQMHSRNALSNLRNKLNDENKNVRRKVIQVIKELNGTEAIQDLEQTLNQANDNDIRRDAALALGELNAYQAIPSLRKALHDKEIQIAAAIALGRMKILEAIPYLRKRAEKQARISRLSRYLAIARLLHHFPGIKNRDFKVEGETFADSQVLQDLIDTPPTFRDQNETNIYLSELKRLLHSTGSINHKSILRQMETVRTSKYYDNQDPFQETKASRRERLVQRILYFMIYLLIIASTSLLLILFNSLASVFQGSLIEAIQIKIFTHPWTAFFVLFLLAMLIGLISLVNERLKNKI